MAKIVIKRRVSLDFLGDDYKDSYLEFSSMNIKEYSDYFADAKKLDEIKSMTLIMDALKRHFLSGKFLDQDVVADDLEQFDPQTLLKAFSNFTGATPDPK